MLAFMFLVLLKDLIGISEIAHRREDATMSLTSRAGLSETVLLTTTLTMRTNILKWLTGMVSLVPQLMKVLLTISAPNKRTHLQSATSFLLSSRTPLKTLTSMTLLASATRTQACWSLFCKPPKSMPSIAPAVKSCLENAISQQTNTLHS